MLLENKINELIITGQPIKLHLGCGPFVLDTYLNVDGEYLKDKEGIFIFDISSSPYPIPDNCVDEILTVHVIEHIERWLLEDMLKEWYRILKPGGIVAIEWPDLLKACQHVVKEPNCLFEQEKKLSKYTIHAIYGNPRFKHRAMMHSYGYSAESMSNILKNNGFIEVKSEENLYKKTKVDSRVVAKK